MSKFYKHIRWRKILYGTLWIISLVGIGFLMSFVEVKSSELACNDVKVIIPGKQSFIARADVDKIINETQGTLVGKTLSAIPIHKLEEDLKAIPFVKKAIVSKDMHGLITIEISQREAVLRVINKIGNDFYLDKKGIKMPLSAHYAPRVLVVNGHIDELYGKALDTIQTPLLRNLYHLSKYIAKDEFLESQIEQLFINNNHSIEMVPRIGDHKIILGDVSFLDEKFEKLQLFYNKVIPAKGWDVYETVDLSFKNQLVCVKKKN